MTQSAEVATFRASVSRVFGGARTEPRLGDAEWAPDWPALRDLGVPELLDPEDGAGVEGMPFAVAAVQQLGEALHAFPGYGVLAASAIGPRLRPLVDGDAPAVGLAWMSSATVATDENDGPARLSGTTRPIAGVVDLALVLLAVEDEPDALYLVDLSEPSATSEVVTTLDISRTFGLLHLDATPAVRVAAEGSEVSRIGRLLVAAETAALVATSVSRTVAYARERVTFGHPIGQYQAVQHRLVDHAIAARQMQDLVDAAADAMATGAADAAERVLLAEIYCSERAHQIVSDCIQLTGGTGFTWEYGLHYPLRRVSANAQLVGGARRARSDLADALGW